MIYVCPTETKLSIERAYFEHELLEEAAHEAMMLYDAPNNAIRFDYQVKKSVDGQDGKSGYVVLRPNFHSSPHVLSQETPAISQIITGLEALPSPHGRIKKKPAKTPVINVAYPGGEVSRHIDAGTNTNHWLGRCATLQGTGIFRRYDITGDVLDTATVTAGDVLTHFNPQNVTRRLPHDAVTLGGEIRISLGLLLPLKRELPWSRSSQAAHATVKG